MNADDLFPDKDQSTHVSVPVSQCSQQDPSLKCGSVERQKAAGNEGRGRNTFDPIEVFY